MKPLLPFLLFSLVLVGCKKQDSAAETPIDTTKPAPQSIPADAILKDDVQGVSQAIAAGADVNAADRTNRDMTPLIKAADSDSAAVAQLLIDHKADINRTDRAGSTALMYAARHNASKVAALLLAQKADVEISDKAGLNALMFAAEANSFEVAKLLIEHGATINGPKDSYGMTPLIRAIKGRSLSVTQLLVDRGANVNSGAETTASHAGTTPLMYAAGYKSLPIVKLLVERGADLKARNHANDTALSLAKKAEMNDEVIAFLEANGAM